MVVRTLVAGAFAVAASVSSSRADIISSVDSFGAGPNQFNIDFVEVGNTGNPSDPRPQLGPGFNPPVGSVSYTYRIGTYEVTQDAIDKAVAGGLTNVSTGPWSGNQPAGNVSWYEAAAFVNWLNTSTGHQAAYDLSWNGTQWVMNTWSSAEAWQDGGENLFRNKDACYFLPSENEWYKAAFHANDGATANYYLYATGSNTAPTPVAGGTLSGSVVYGGQSAPALVNSAGGLSPYGTMGQDGNVWEWSETADDGLNTSPTEDRVIRGAGYSTLTNEPWVRADWGGYDSPDNPAYNSGVSYVGFRVASIVPEPSSLVLVAVSALSLAARRRRSAKR